MGSSRLTLKRSVLLSTVTLLSILSAPAFGQDTVAPPPAPEPSEPAPPPAPQASSTVPAPNNPQTSVAPPPPPPPAQTTTPQQNAPSSTPAQNTPSSRPQTTNNAPRPSISATGPNQRSSTGVPPPLPTLVNPAGIPNYPPPVVPPTQKAPFMNRSTMPDGTVFIAVGAILAAFAVAVIAWRGIVACLLHRSVQRAAHEQHVANDKATFTAGPAITLYGHQNDKESSASLAMGVRRSTRGLTPSATPSQTNLFFSPTAPTAGLNGGARESRFLPSGFYAAGGSSSPAYGHGHSISLTNLRPDSRTHSRAMGPTPPDSPSLGPSRVTPAPRNISTTSLSLNRPPSGRAPSAYLDDLLDDHGPGAFPHPGVPGGPNHHHTYSNSTQGGQPSRPF